MTEANPDDAAALPSTSSVQPTLRSESDNIAAAPSTSTEQRTESDYGNYERRKLNVAEMQNIFNLPDIVRNLSTREQCVQFAEDNNMIPTLKLCRSHKIPMKIQYGQNNNVGSFVCNKGNCRARSRVARGKSTWFENIRISMPRVFYLMYCYAHRYSYEMAIHDDLDRRATGQCLSNTTICDWYSYCRETVVIYQLHKQQNCGKIGGPGKIVQIDESKFGKRKYNKGRRVEGHWVLGLIEDGSEDLRLEVCPENVRSAEVLVPLIKKHVLEGTTIHTDYWRAYDCLGQHGYIHKKVNHSDPDNPFVAPDGVHTQRIESQWRVTTPERKRKDETTKSSSEILSELFGAFNADPPKIEDIPVKKSKKSKKKHKKEKKKRSRSSSSSSSDDSDYSHKRKKRKKNKSKKRKDSEKSPSRPRGKSPPIKPDPDLVKSEPIKKEDVKKEKVKTEPKVEPKRRVSIKSEETKEQMIDASLIPMPESPTKEYTLDSSDLRFKLDKKTENTSESDKAKGKIQIKNLKFSAVFEETVKKAEEEARKKAEKVEDGELTDSSSSSAKDETPNLQFPKSADPGGILKKQEEIKMFEEEKLESKKSRHSESSRKSTKTESSRPKKRSSSRSKRSRSRSASRRYHRSSSKSHRRSRSRHRSSSRSRRRSTSRTRARLRHHSPRHHSPRHRRRSSRSPTGVRLADSEKKRLLEVARRNAINMLKNGAVPAGAAALPPHTRNQVMAAIQSGGKSVDELTDFCKHLSKKEALGELSSVSSHDDDMSENEDTIAFHHPFLVKEKAPIVMNIRGGAPLPIKNSLVPVANKDELRLQFPVSSGTQHREWVPVTPTVKKDMQVAKISSTASSKPAAKSSESTKPSSASTAPLALPAPPPATSTEVLKGFSGGTQLSTVSTVATLPAPGPQAYPPGIEPPKIDLASIVSQKIAMIRKEQEQNEISDSRGFGWSKDATLGQFTGSTGAHILTPRELASGTQAWAKKDQLVRAAPVEGGMGMHLLQKMGWTPGRGLGKEGTGALQPLLLEVKLDTKGLQAKEETSNRSGKGMKVQRLGRRGPAPLVSGGKHPVSLLGEYCSKQKLGPPEYTLCFECGPDHKKNFLFKVKVAGVEYQPAVASANKKQAKADSAQLALQKLGIVIT